MAVNNDYNCIVFDVNKSGSKEALWNDVATFLRLAQAQENICVVRTEILDSVIAVEYQHDESIEGWGCDNPRWITNDEWENIISEREFNDKKEELNED